MIAMTSPGAGLGHRVRLFPVPGNVVGVTSVPVPLGSCDPEVPVPPVGSFESGLVESGDVSFEPSNSAWRSANSLASVLWCCRYSMPVPHNW